METTVTRNGQITLPKEWRDAAGIKEGARLTVWIEGSDLIVRSATKRPWELPGGGGFTDEIMAEVRALRASNWRYP